VGFEGRGGVPEQPGLSFAALLRQLRVEARLTQEELAEAAQVSQRAVSDLERGINRTARRDTAVLLAEALGLDGPARELFVTVARGQAPATELLAAARGEAPGSLAGHRAQLAWWLQAVIDSPYRGLAVFEEQDAAFFFGRETATTQVLERMARLSDGAGLLAVSGASGAGKSSLLRAGVLPRIREAGLVSLPGAESWACLLLTPTHAPLDELALRVAVLAGLDAAAVRRGLDTSPEGFALTACQAALAWPRTSARDVKGRTAERDQQMPHRLLLVVDQFEELFTQCADERQRRAFITALHAAATAGHGPDRTPAALVVLGVRADFEARCADYRQLADAVQDRYLVTPMTERQLRMAITEPAKKAGSEVDDDLVEVLLAEVRTGQPGAFGAGMLPLLSHALDQAWRGRAGKTLTLADYERTGGIEGAVATSAQRAYDRLTPAQQAAARQVFTRLTATSSEGLDTADRASRAGLTDGKTAAEIQDVEAVLEAFTAERLITLAADSVEISHEVLLTAWPLLRDTWLTDIHADRIVRTRLHATAAEWARHSRDPSYLYSGSLLQAATDTVTRVDADPARHPPLSQAERDFLHASNRVRRRTTHRRRAVIAGLLVLTLTAITAAGIAAHNAAAAARNAANATRQHALALSRRLAAESLAIDPASPVIARRLAVAAWSVYPTDQAGSVLTTLLAEQQQNGILPADPSGVSGVAFSPDGHLLASAGLDGILRLWNPATGQPAGAPLHAASARGGVSTVAFSPDGHLLASAGLDGIVRLWNPATGQPAGAPLHVDAQGGVLGVAFSPDGHLLASADSDGTLRLWNLGTGQPAGAPLQAGAMGGVLGVAFSHDGKLLASIDGDGIVRLWNPATGQPVGAPLQPGLQVSVLGVAFSPDGRLASADSDGTVQLWNPATGQPVGAPLQADALGVAFSRDGKLLASADGDGTVRLWNPATGQPVGAPLQATAQGGVLGVAFSRDGKLLASADGDGTVRLWNPATGQPVGAPLDATAQGGVLGVAFIHDGRLLASADGDGTVRLWNPAASQPVGAAIKATGLQNGVEEVAFSANGQLLASADTNGTVRLWNPATGQVVGTLVSHPQGGYSDVAFSPNGGLLVTADGNGGVLQLWNPATRQPIGAPLQTDPNGVYAVAFSPSGKLLASADGDGLLRVWNPATRQPVGPPIKTVGDGARGMALSPNGKMLAAPEGNGTVQLWNPATGQPAGAPLRTSTQANVNSVAFSPSGKLLASADADGAVEVWNLATGQPVGTPLQAGTQNGVSEVVFSPDGQLLASVNADGTVRLWKVSLFTHPYAALCADAGPPTHQEWAKYAPGDPQPKICA
jgi:WD40 repeat protein/transcriptional regulator with XRE-family HTH domain